MNYGGVLTNYSEFSDDEKLNYSLKISLSRLQTELNRAWYQEPKDFAPKGPETIYKNKLPSYVEISNFQLIDPYCKVNGVINTSVITNVTVGDILNNSSNASGWGYGDTNGSKEFYIGNNNKSVRDNNVNITNITEAQNGLSKLMFTRYNYWKNGLTGKNSSTNGIALSNTNGTYSNKNEPENAILSYVNGNLSSTRTWKAYDDNLGKNNAEDQFFTKLTTYSSPIKIIDPSNINTSDYTDITKAHPFLEIYIQVPTISTRQVGDNNNTSTTGNTNGTDNIGFFNPVLRQSLGDVEGFKYIVRGWGGNLAKWTDLTIETGDTNNTNIFYFLNNPGFILCYGVKDIINGLNLSYKYPPLISFIRYTGETFSDGIISQGPTLPTIANNKDLFIDTSNNALFRFDISGNTKKWVQVGGTQDTNNKTNVSIDICDNAIYDGQASTKTDGSLLIDKHKNMFFVNDGSYNSIRTHIDICNIVIKSKTTPAFEPSGTLIIDASYKLFVVNDGSYNLISGNNTSTEIPTDLSLTSLDVSVNVTIDGSLSAIDASFSTIHIKNIIVDGSSRELLPYVTSAQSGNYAMVDNDGKWTLSTSSSSYILPPATKTELGGIKVGTGLEISTDGILSVSGGTSSAGSGINEYNSDDIANGNNALIYYNTPVKEYRAKTDKYYDILLNNGLIIGQPPIIRDLSVYKKAHGLYFSWKNPIQYKTLWNSDTDEIEYPVGDKNFYLPVVRNIIVEYNEENSKDISYILINSTNISSHIDINYYKIRDASLSRYHSDDDKVTGMTGKSEKLNTDLVVKDISYSESLVNGFFIFKDNLPDGLKDMYHHTLDQSKNNIVYYKTINNDEKFKKIFYENKNRISGGKTYKFRIYCSNLTTESKYPNYIDFKNDLSKNSHLFNKTEITASLANFLKPQPVKLATFGNEEYNKDGIYFTLDISYDNVAKTYNSYKIAMHVEKEILYSRLISNITNGSNLNLEYNSGLFFSEMKVKVSSCNAYDNRKITNKNITWSSEKDLVFNEISGNSNIQIHNDKTKILFNRSRGISNSKMTDKFIAYSDISLVTDYNKFFRFEVLISNTSDRNNYSSTKENVSDNSYAQYFFLRYQEPKKPEWNENYKKLIITPSNSLYELIINPKAINEEVLSKDNPSLNVTFKDDIIQLHLLQLSISGGNILDIYQTYPNDISYSIPTSIIRQNDYLKYTDLNLVNFFKFNFNKFKHKQTTDSQKYSIKYRIKNELFGDVSDNDINNSTGWSEWSDELSFNILKPSDVNNMNIKFFKGESLNDPEDYIKYSFEKPDLLGIVSTTIPNDISINVNIDRYKLTYLDLSNTSNNVSEVFHVNGDYKSLPDISKSFEYIDISGNLTMFKENQDFSFIIQSSNYFTSYNDGSTNSIKPLEKPDKPQIISIIISDDMLISNIKEPSFTVLKSAIPTNKRSYTPTNFDGSNVISVMDLSFEVYANIYPSITTHERLSDICSNLQIFTNTVLEPILNNIMNKNNKPIKFSYTVKNVLNTEYSDTQDILFMLEKPKMNDIPTSVDDNFPELIWTDNSPTDFYFDLSVNNKSIHITDICSISPLKSLIDIGGITKLKWQIKSNITASSKSNSNMDISDDWSDFSDNFFRNYKGRIGYWNQIGDYKIWFKVKNKYNSNYISYNDEVYIGNDVSYLDVKVEKPDQLLNNDISINIYISNERFNNSNNYILFSIYFSNNYYTGLKYKDISDYIYTDNYSNKPELYIKQLDISYNYNSNKLDITTNKFLPDKVVNNKYSVSFENVSQYIDRNNTNIKSQFNVLNSLDISSVYSDLCLNSISFIQPIINNNDINKVNTFKNIDAYGNLKLILDPSDITLLDFNKSGNQLDVSLNESAKKAYWKYIIKESNDLSNNTILYRSRSEKTEFIIYESKWQVDRKNLKKYYIRYSIKNDFNDLSLQSNENNNNCYIETKTPSEIGDISLVININNHDFTSDSNTLEYKWDICNNYTSGLEYKDGVLISPKRDSLALKKIVFDSISVNKEYDISYILNIPFNTSTKRTKTLEKITDLSNVINRTRKLQAENTYETYDVSGYIINHFDMSSNKINRKFNYRFHEPRMNSGSFDKVNELSSNNSGEITLTLKPSNINRLSSDTDNNKISIDISTDAKKIQWSYNITTDKNVYPTSYSNIQNFSNQTVTQFIDATNFNTIGTRYIYYRCKNDFNDQYLQINNNDLSNCYIETKTPSEIGDISLVININNHDFTSILNTLEYKWDICNNYTSGLEYKDGVLTSPKRDSLALKKIVFDSSSVNKQYDISYILNIPFNTSTKRTKTLEKITDLSNVINRTRKSQSENTYETYDVSGYIINQFDLSSNKINRKFNYRFHEPSMNNGFSFDKVNELSSSDIGDITLKLKPSNINRLSSDTDNNNKISIDISPDAKKIQWSYNITTDKDVYPTSYSDIQNFSNDTVTQVIDALNFNTIDTRYIYYRCKNDFNDKYLLINNNDLSNCYIETKNPSEIGDISLVININNHDFTSDSNTLEYKWDICDNYTSGLEYKDGVLISPKRDSLALKKIVFDSISVNKEYDISYILNIPFNTSTKRTKTLEKITDLSNVINRTRHSYTTSYYESYDVTGYIINHFDLSSNKINRIFNYRFHEPYMNSGFSFDKVNELSSTAIGNFTLSLNPTNINMLSYNKFIDSKISIDISTDAKKIQWSYNITTDKNVYPTSSSYSDIQDFSNQTVTQVIDATNFNTIGTRYIYYRCKNDFNDQYLQINNNDLSNCYIETKNPSEIGDISLVININNHDFTSDSNTLEYKWDICNNYTSGLEYKDGVLTSPKRDSLALKRIVFDSSSVNRQYNKSYTLNKPFNTSTKRTEILEEIKNLSNVIKRTRKSQAENTYETYDVSGYIINHFDLLSDKINRKFDYRFHEPSMKSGFSFDKVNELSSNYSGEITLTLKPTNIDLLSSSVNGSDINININDNAKKVIWKYKTNHDSNFQNVSTNYSKDNVTTTLSFTQKNIYYIQYSCKNDFNDRTLSSSAINDNCKIDISNMTAPDFSNPTIHIFINNYMKHNASNYIEINMPNFNTTTSNTNHYGMILYDGNSNKYPVLTYYKNIKIIGNNNNNNSSSKNDLTSSTSSTTFTFQDVNYYANNNISLEYYYKNILDNLSSIVDYNFSLNFKEPKMKSTYSFNSSAVSNIDANVDGNINIDLLNDNIDGLDIDNNNNNISYSFNNDSDKYLYWQLYVKNGNNTYINETSSYTKNKKIFTINNSDIKDKYDINEIKYMCANNFNDNLAMTREFSSAFAFKITNNFQQLSEPGNITIQIDDENNNNIIYVSSTNLIPSDYNYGLEIFNNSSYSSKPELKSKYNIDLTTTNNSTNYTNNNYSVNNTPGFNISNIKFEKNDNVQLSCNLINIYNNGSKVITKQYPISFDVPSGSYSVVPSFDNITLSNKYTSNFSFNISFKPNFPNNFKPLPITQNNITIQRNTNTETIFVLTKLYYSNTSTFNTNNVKSINYSNKISGHNSYTSTIQITKNLYNSYSSSELRLITKYSCKNYFNGTEKDSTISNSIIRNSGPLTISNNSASININSGTGANDNNSLTIVFKMNHTISPKDKLNKYKYEIQAATPSSSYTTLNNAEDIAPTDNNKTINIPSSSNFLFEPNTNYNIKIKVIDLFGITSEQVISNESTSFAPSPLSLSYTQTISEILNSYPNKNSSGITIYKKTPKTDIIIYNVETIYQKTQMSTSLSFANKTTTYPPNNNNNSYITFDEVSTYQANDKKVHFKHATVNIKQLFISSEISAAGQYSFAISTNRQTSINIFSNIQFDTIDENPSFNSKNISYTPFKSLGLPIVTSDSDYYPRINLYFDNKSIAHIAKTGNIEIEFGVVDGSSYNKYSNTKVLNSGDVQRTNNIVSNRNLIDIVFTPYDNVMNVSPKNLQFRYKFKNINGQTNWITDNSCFIWDPKTIKLLNENNQSTLSLTKVDYNNTVSQPSNNIIFDNGNYKMKVMEPPTNFDPAYKTSANQQLLTKKMLTKDKNTSKIMIYNGLFCSHQYFINEIENLTNSSFSYYHTDVETIYNEIKNSIVQSPPDFTSTIGDGRWYQPYNPPQNALGHLETKFNWQIFNFKFQNSYSAAVNVTRCTIKLNNTNIKNADIIKSINSDGTYKELGDGHTSDIELWIKCKRGNDDETRWNKLSKNSSTLYNKSSSNFSYIDNKYDSTDSNIKQQTSSLYSATEGANELSLDVALFHTLSGGGEINNGNFMNIYFAVGMRKNKLVKKYMSIPTIYKLGFY